MSDEVAAARRLTERIRLITLNIADNVEKLRALVAEAKESEAHVALGYASWTAYLSDLFGNEPLRLARDVRKELVAELNDQGMSQRAIARVVGVKQPQVSKDLQVIPEESPESEAPQFGDIPAWADGPAPEPAVGEPVIVAKPRVTGLDGKTYTPKPKPALPPLASAKSPEQENAEQVALLFGRSLQTLARVAEADGRGVVLRAWERGSEACSPAVRDYVSPAWIRTIARGLNAIANQLEQS